MERNAKQRTRENHQLTSPVVDPPTTGFLNECDVAAFMLSLQRCTFMTARIHNFIISTMLLMYLTQWIFCRKYGDHLKLVTLHKHIYASFYAVYASLER